MNEIFAESSCFLHLDNPFRRMASLKRVERSAELKSAFEKAKPKVLELRKLERSELRTQIHSSCLPLLILRSSK